MARLLPLLVLLLLLPVLLLLHPAGASEGCIVASCSDTDAQLHEGTCLNRCDCIWDSEGTPKSAAYPSCQTRPDTDELHVTSYQSSFDVYMSDEKGAFQMCEDGDASCKSSEYKDPRCTTADGMTPAEKDWERVPVPQDGASSGFAAGEWILSDDPALPLPHNNARQPPKPTDSGSGASGENPPVKPAQRDIKGDWGKGAGWTRCASENVKYLAQDDCPDGYCALEGNSSRAPWKCCNKCPGGNSQCLVHSCKCRCTKDCATPIRTPVTGHNVCTCGAEGTIARIGNGNSWSEPKSMPGTFTCNAAAFGLTALPAGVVARQAHCECDNTIAVTEKAGAGEGYAQCSSWGMKRARGSHAVYTGGANKPVPTSIENYHFKVDLRVSMSSDAVHGSTGVVFRYQDDKNYYRFVISRYCSSLVRVKGGVQERLLTKYGSTGGGVSKGTSGRESEWVTVGVTVESNDISITVDYAYDEEYNECDQDDPTKCRNDANSHKGRGTILRIQKEENPVKAITSGRFGLYSARSAGSLWRNLRYTTQLCSHVRSFLVPDRDVDDWEVAAVHAKKSTSGTVGGLMVATASGFYSNDNWMCTTKDPTSTKLGATKWYAQAFVLEKSAGWAQAKIIDTSKKGVGKDIMHPHDIVGAADWIWADDKGTADEVWCRGERGTEAADWHGHSYYVEQPKKNWASAELSCIGLGPGCHLASIHGSEENELVLNMARSVLGRHTAFWIGLNDEDEAEGNYVFSDASETDWYNWSPGEPNDYNNNEDCTEMNTWNGEWNDNACNKKIIPFVCKCPIPDDAPEDPSDTGDLPDEPSDIDGGGDGDGSGSAGSEDSDDSSEICAMFQGGQGADASSWFNTPAKKYGSTYLCNVFDSRSSCCSSDWAFDNVFWDLLTLTDDINDENTACANAIEALRCVICSPRQAHFMKYADDKWEIDVCLPTALATFEFCSREKATLFPKGAEALDRFGDDPRRMLTNLLTRNVGTDWIWDDSGSSSSGKSADDYDAQTGEAKGSRSPTVKIVPSAKGCFLHDRAAPRMKGASASSDTNGANVALTLTFNEPLDGESLRGKVVALRPDMVNTSTRGGSGSQQNELANEAALLRVYKCASANCVVQATTSTPDGGSTTRGEIDGEIVAAWDDLASAQRKGHVSVTTTPVGTGEIRLVVSEATQLGADGGALSKDAAGEHGYVVWLETGAVLDAAQNAFGGSDLDVSGLVHVNMDGVHTPPPPGSDSSGGANVGAIVGGVIGGIVVLALVAFAVNMVMKRRGGNAPPLGSDAMYSSGGFMKMGD